MALSAVATPYAMALLDLAVDTGTLSTVRGQIDRIDALYAKSPELQVAFGNPTISTDERKKVVQSLAVSLALSPTTKNFLLVLAEKGRLAALPDIAAVLGRLADERTGVAKAEVVSTAPLDAGQMARLQATLGTMTGKTVTLSNTVDPSLIGGLRVSVDGKVYDTSVAMQLRKLREAILSDL